MTILVTGAAGYIGSQIVHTLNRLYNQPKVIGLDNLSTGHTCPLPHGFECFHGDVAHYGFVSNLLERYKVDQIIHCAASVVVPESVEQPLFYYANNTIASYELIRAAIAAKVKGFVFSSTAAVYGQPDLLGNRPIREDDPCKPMSPYGRSKLMVEDMLRDIHEQHGMATVILRYFNVAGADPLCQTGQYTDHATHLVSRAVRAGLGKIPKLQVYGADFPTKDGTAVRDYVHVADLADAHTRALESNARHGGCLTLNVGSGMGYSVLEVINAVRRELQTEFPTEIVDHREGDPASIVADTKLIERKFSWVPQYTLDSMVKHAVAWEKTRG